MRLLTLIFFSIILLSSCRKDKREFTSDFPNGYRTDVYIDYYEATNRTQVSVGFTVPAPDAYSQSQGIVLPPESYLKFNGTEMTVPSGYTFYQNYFEGKSICVIEFLDFDGTIYKNTLFPPDTAYFVNLPDTVSSFEDFQLLINAPLLDSNETTNIAVNAHGSDYGNEYYLGPDSLVDWNYYPTLESGLNHTIYLYRNKYLKNKHLPAGGGSISYRYIVEETFYTP